MQHVTNMGQIGLEHLFDRFCTESCVFCTESRDNFERLSDMGPEEGKPRVLYFSPCLVVS
jgi:hypothetical protein